MEKQEIKLEEIQCHSCLSVGRQLKALGKYAEIYRTLTTNLEYHDPQLSAHLLICWECQALLRRVVQFQQKVEKANEALQSGENFIYSTFSTLTSTVLNETNENTYINNDDNIHADNTDITKSEIKESYSEFYTEDYNDICINTNDITNLSNSKSECLDTKVFNLERPKPVNRWARKKALQNKKPKFKILTSKDVNELFKHEKIDKVVLENNLQNRRCSKSYVSKRYKCETCITGFKDEISLSRHYNNYHKMTTGSYFCDVCTSVFKRKRHLVKHISRHYKQYICLVCKYSTSNIKQRNKHAERHKNVFQCLKCELMFGSRREFYKHFKEWHERFTCDHCGITFKMRYCIKEHIRKQHSPFECVLCCKRFSRYNGLWLHNKTHHSAPSAVGGPAYCVECDKHYPDKYRYRWHLANSAKHNPRKKSKIPCPGCDKVFSKNIYMRDHYDLVHLQCFKYRCEQCNKNFIRNADLVKHRRRVHEGILPPKNKICYMCGRGFTTNKILANHVRTHTGERPFACALCPARFAQSAALAGHARALHHTTAV